MSSKLKKYPFFILLLPLFFLVHGVLENYNPVLPAVALRLYFIYAFAGLVMTGLFYLIFRDTRQAAFLAFIILAFNFFFGSTHDMLKRNFAGTFIVKFSVLVSLFLLVLAMLAVWLKRRKPALLKTTLYLNLLLILLVAIDAAQLITVATKKQKQTVADLRKNFVKCDTCATPDVYLVVADEYAGNRELEEIFKFDNSEFYDGLKQRGFRVNNNTSSNYNATVYSMASLFSMDYVKNLEGTKVNHRDMLKCRGLINQNNIIHFFRERGYEFYNHSYFEFEGQDKLVYNPFYPTSSALLIAQTFTNRFIKTVGFHFVSQKRLEDIRKHHLYNNRKIDSATRKTVAMKSTSPKFVYTHLAMPHHPYYFDSSGKEATFDMLSDWYTLDKNAYTQYLLFANQKILSLIDHIKNNSPTPPVIILLSDHGFRQFVDQTDKQYYFMNLNAVLIPSGNYRSFYDGMTNVNIFRALLNDVYSQKLPILKDSTSFLWEN